MSGESVVPGQAGSQSSALFNETMLNCPPMCMRRSSGTRTAVHEGQAGSEGPLATVLIRQAGCTSPQERQAVSRQDQGMLWCGMLASQPSERHLKEARRDTVPDQGPDCNSVLCSWLREGPAQAGTCCKSLVWSSHCGQAGYAAI